MNGQLGFEEAVSGALTQPYLLQTVASELQWQKPYTPSLRCVALASPLFLITG